MNKTEIRKYFLDNSDAVIHSLIELFTKPETAVLSSMQQHALKLMWPTLHTIIVNAGDLDAQTATNGAEVLSLIGQGKVTVKEAKELMSLLQQKQEMDELPKLIAALEKAGTGS